MPVVGSGWDVPPEVDSIGDFRWWKLGVSKVLVLTMVSTGPIWYRGHFVSKRMVPCVGDGCKWCAAKVGSQMRFVFAAAERTSGTVGLMEVGRSVALELRDMSERAGAFRGMRVEFTRSTHSKQSRMEVALQDPEEDGWWKKLTIPEVRKALQATWKRGGAVEEEALSVPEMSGGPAGFRPKQAASKLDRP